MSEEYYFSYDGTYGSAEHILIADTAQWSDDEWEEVEEASDSKRLDVVEKLITKYSTEEISK